MLCCRTQNFDLLCSCNYNKDDCSLANAYTIKQEALQLEPVLAMESYGAKFSHISPIKKNNVYSPDLQAQMGKAAAEIGATACSIRLFILSISSIFIELQF